MSFWDIEKRELTKSENFDQWNNENTWLMFPVIIIVILLLIILL